MVIKLQIAQIVEHWELIKFTALSANDVKAEHISGYCKNLLVDLLSSKSCCLIRIDPDTRKILAVAVYEININKLTSQKYVHFSSLYAFERVKIKEWADIINTLAESFKKDGCSYLTFDTTNPRSIVLHENAGFKLKTKSFIREL